MKPAIYIGASEVAREVGDGSVRLGMKALENSDNLQPVTPFKQAEVNFALTWALPQILAEGEAAQFEGGNGE